MGIQVIRHGESIEVELGILSEVNEEIAVFSVREREIQIPIDDQMKESLLDMDSENTLFAIHLPTREIILDFKDPEMDNEMLTGIFDEF